MNLEEYLGSLADVPGIVVAQREQVLSGELLLVQGEKGDFGTIPQLIVESYAALVQLARSWEEEIAASQRPGVLLFRGQTRDYCKGIASRVIPAGFRGDNTWADPAKMGDHLRAEAAKWEAVVASLLGIPSREFAFSHICQGRGDSSEMKRFYLNRSPTAKLIGDPRFLAVLKHYGFPTPNLDVTTDLRVALWFALHRARTGSDGLIHFSPVANQVQPASVLNGTAAARAEWLATTPSVYVFAEWHDESTIDLTKLEGLSAIARRPSRQAAWSLPFVVSDLTPLGVWGSRSYGVPVRFVPRDWLPRAVFKLAFSTDDLPSDLQYLTAAHLFPEDDPVYRALDSADVPLLARYR